MLEDPGCEEAKEEMERLEEEGPPYPPSEFTSLARYLNGILKENDTTKIGDEFAHAFPAFARCIAERRGVSQGDVTAGAQAEDSGSDMDPGDFFSQRVAFGNAI